MSQLGSEAYFLAAAPQLLEALTREGGVRIEAFAGILMEKLRRLESEHLAGIPVRDVHDPPGAAPVPLSGDALKNLHFAVVAAGRTRFLRILRHSREVADHIWDFAESDAFAVAVSRAHEHTTGEPWQGPLPGFHTVEADDTVSAAAGISPG
ncbi:hypothetical protein [Streptomyces vietnamensis]|uniref:Uncharacterized protein n=1 Tax=Streptomyces vietnamensis TaxID=362257 RepID=A0A0B5HNW2_9ACTN|nr:hypothetical protein [Streptomyces vietnamensis]AJF63800.1 hypothetical protein SVTN_04490 [Streptomyces vietnamensis]